MLAKIWKKVLLIICILACLFNVMSKILNKKSLELQIDSVKNGSSLSEIFNTTTENVSESNTNTGNNVEENKLNTTIKVVVQ